MDKQEIHLIFERSATTEATLINVVESQCIEWVNKPGCQMIREWLTGLREAEGETFKITLSIEETSP